MRGLGGSCAGLNRAARADSPGGVRRAPLHAVRPWRRRGPPLSHACEALLRGRKGHYSILKVELTCRGETSLRRASVFRGSSAAARAAHPRQAAAGRRRRSRARTAWGVEWGDACCGGLRTAVCAQGQRATRLRRRTSGPAQLRTAWTAPLGASLRCPALRSRAAELPLLRAVLGPGLRCGARLRDPGAHAGVHASLRGRPLRVAHGFGPSLAATGPAGPSCDLRDRV